MTIPQWEACKVCGGDHWTKDHTTLEGHRICEENMDAEIARQAATIATLRAALDGLGKPMGEWLVEMMERNMTPPEATLYDALRAALAATKETP